MKKVFLAILSLLYIVSSIGVTMQTDYCLSARGDKGVSHNKYQTGDKCGNEKINRNHNDCCRIENNLVKNNDDQKIPGPPFKPTPVTAIALLPSFTDISFNTPRSLTKTNELKRSPPPKSNLALYILNCIFLI